MPDEAERLQVNIRLEPSLHLLMKCGGSVLNMGITQIYERAAEEFLVNHPEIMLAIGEQLATENSIVVGAFEKLTKLKSDVPE